MPVREFFAARPRLAAVIALATALVGIYAARFVAVSDYPELAPTIVEVSTTYSGASPSVIADTVATPIEDQINSVENVYFFDSRCSDSGTYELYVTFLPGTDPDMNLVKVQNAVKRAEPKLPSEVLQVGLAIEKCSSDYAVQFLFTTDGSEMDLVSLGNFVNHEIKDALQRVRGVSSVSCSNNEYAMRVWLDTMKMDALGISVADVRAAVAGQNIQPAAGFVGNAMSSPYLSYKVNAPGRLVTAAEFEAIVVRTDPATGARVTLGDIARCELGFKSYTQEPRLDGKLCFLRAIGGRDSDHILAVYGLKIVPHGNDPDSLLRIAFLFPVGACRVSELSFLVVSHHHIGGAPIRVVGNRIDCHCHVAGGIAERQYRLLSDLADDGINLAGFRVFTLVASVEHDLVRGLERVIRVSFPALVGRRITVLGSDHVRRRNGEGTVNQLTDNIALCGGDDIHGKIIFQQGVEKLQHRLIKRLAARHA